MPFRTKLHRSWHSCDKRYYKYNERTFSLSKSLHESRTSIYNYPPCAIETGQISYMTGTDEFHDRGEPLSLLYFAPPGGLSRELVLLDMLYCLQIYFVHICIRNVRRKVQ